MAVLTAPRWNPAELEECVEAFESAWKQEGRAALGDFLPPANHAYFKSILCELVRVDMEFRWSHNDFRRAADYLADFPILDRDKDLVRQIAYEEYRQRLQVGEVVDRGEYQRLYGIDVSEWPQSDAPQLNLSIACGTREVDFNSNQSFVAAAREPAAPPKHHRRPDKTKMPAIGDFLLHFRVVGNLGEGAFGRVFLAEQTDLSNRRVALKLTPDENAEPQMLAELQHANIVPINSVHRFGTMQIICMPYHGSTTLKHVIDEVARAEGSFPSTGRAFLSTLFDRSKSAKADSSSGPPAAAKNDSGVRKASPLSGSPAAKRLSELDKLANMKPVDAALRIMLGVTEGLVHAHDRGLIHRDLKPANVLLADDGTPMLLDFNLAAHTTEGPRMQRLRMGGTFPYMAPEQLDAIRRKRVSRDARSDLYSLGVMLFELLTGQHPFPKNKCSQADFLDQMLDDRRRPLLDPRQFNRAIPASVVSMIHKLLSPDPILRYQSAADLKEDLERQLESRPLRHARERSLRERVRKFRTRHPRLTAASVASLAVSLFVLLPVSLLAYNNAEIARREREKNRAEAVMLMQDAMDKCATATACLAERNSEARIGRLGLSLVEDLRNRLGIRADGAWAADAELARLSEPEKQRLMRGLGEMMLTTADSKRRWADDAHDAAMRDEALIWNRLAEVCYARAGQKTPDRVKWQRDLLSGKAAEGAAKEAPQLAKMDDAELYASACELLSELHYRKALTLLDELTTRDPKHFMGWYYKGTCCDLLGFDERAIRAWTVCIALKPDFSNSYVNRARSLARRGENQNAINDLDRALTLDSSLTSALIDRAVARRNLRDLEGAERDLDAALTHDDAPTRIYFIRSTVRRQMGKKDAADRDLAEGMKLEPRDELDYTQRGFARISGEPNAALADFDKALRINPRYRPALMNKAYLLGEVFSKPEQAILVLNEMLRIHPYDLNALAGRGVYNARLGRVEEATADAEECMKFCRDAQGYFHLACVYSLLAPHQPKARDEAIRLLTMALRNGMSRPEQLRTDKDLDPLRKDAEFNRLVELAGSLSTRTKPVKKQNQTEKKN